MEEGGGWAQLRRSAKLRVRRSRGMEPSTQAYRRNPFGEAGVRLSAFTRAYTGAEPPACRYASLRAVCGSQYPALPAPERLCRSFTANLTRGPFGLANSSGSRAPCSPATWLVPTRSPDRRVRYLRELNVGSSLRFYKMCPARGGSTQLMGSAVQWLPLKMTPSPCSKAISSRCAGLSSDVRVRRGSRSALTWPRARQKGIERGLAPFAR
jgi:hypothetical protein